MCSNVLQTFWKTLSVHHILQANNIPVSPAPPRIIHLCLLINCCVESDVLGAIKALKCALQGGLQEQNWEKADLLDVLILWERKWLPYVCIPEAIRKLKPLLFVLPKDETLQSGSVGAVKWGMTKTWYCLFLVK